MLSQKRPLSRTGWCVQTIGGGSIFCGTNIRLCRGEFSNRLAAGSEQANLQAAGRCINSDWKNCGSPWVAIYRTELCLCALMNVSVQEVILIISDPPVL